MILTDNRMDQKRIEWQVMVCYTKLWSISVRKLLFWLNPNKLKTRP